MELYNDTKFKALLDGLECNEVMLSAVKNETLGLRLDADYFKKTDYSILNLIKGHKHFYLNKSEVFTGPFGSLLTAPSHLKNGYIPLVRSVNINRGFYIDRQNLVYISEEDNQKIKHSQLFEDDIVLSRVGSIGYFARVDSSMGSCNISSNNIGIRLNRYDRCLKHYILTYLNTNSAIRLVTRVSSGNVQPKLTTKEMCQIPIPVFTTRLYIRISDLVVMSEDALTQADRQYREAESILSSALGIEGNVYDVPIVSIKLLSKSFLQTGRLDAEYYQPKFDYYLDIIHSFDTTVIPLEYEVYKNNGTNYDEGATDVGVVKTKQLINSGVDLEGVESFFAEATCTESNSTFLENDDVVFASMGVGSLGKASIFFSDEDEKYVTDSTLRIFRAKKDVKVLPEVLCVYLQSNIGQELIYRYVVGSTGIISIYDSDMAKIPIPILADDIQKTIASKVKESFALRRKSKKLLEFAKQAVEMAIEQGEDVALEWLKTNS